MSRTCYGGASCRRWYTSGGPSCSLRISNEDMVPRAIAHMLGLVEECEGACEARAPVAKSARAMLEPVAEMLRATEAVSAKSTAAAARWA